MSYEVIIVVFHLCKKSLNMIYNTHHIHYLQTASRNEQFRRVPKKKEKRSQGLVSRRYSSCILYTVILLWSISIKTTQVEKYGFTNVPWSTMQLISCFLKTKTLYFICLWWTPAMPCYCSKIFFIQSCCAPNVDVFFPLEEN